MHINRKDVCLVLDNIRSRENVGSIFRTADAAGVSKIYLCGITPTPHQTDPLTTNRRGGFGAGQAPDKIAKTALGAEKWVPWEYHRQTWRLLAKLKKEGINIIALEQTKDAENIFMFGSSTSKHTKPMALVVGNEVRGLSPQILKYCDKKISIPMYGKKESLNVAVAAGVALYSIINA